MTDSVDRDTDKFECPDVQVGDIVLWSGDYGGKPTPAIVEAIGKGRYRSRISLKISHPETVTFDIRTGCPHRDDPDQRVTEDEELGMWQEGPMYHRFQDLKEEVENLKLSLAGASDPVSARGNV